MMKPWLRLHVVMLCLIVFFTLSSAGRNSAAAQSSSPTLTLQQQIDSALDGAILEISPGTYTENLTIHDKSLTLRGSDPNTTVIQAANSSLRVITADSAKGLTLENLTITGGHPTGDGGGGVYANGGALHITNCHITNNSAAYGGGVFLNLETSSLVMSNSVVSLNSTTNHGGGIYAAGAASITNTNFDSNSAGFHGGAIHVQAGATVLSGGVFSNNHALNGNGGAVNVNNDLSITGTQFDGNTSTNQGGAVNQWNPSRVVTINAATFSNNTTYSQGGGAYVVSNLTLTNSTFTGNKVDSLASGSNVYGGGLYSVGNLTVDHSTFTNNQAKCNYCSFNEGGAIDSKYNAGPVTVTNSTFDGNKGWFGGGMNGHDLFVTNTIFKNSTTGGYGGGIDAVDLHGDYLLFQDNSVLNNGGAIDATNITLSHSRFIHNIAMNGGAIIAHGSFEGSNLLFTRNSASSQGEDLILKSSATAELYNVTFANPSAVTGAAIYLEASAVLNLNNSIANNYTNAIYLGGTGSTLTEDYNLFYGNSQNVVAPAGTIYNAGAHSTTLYAAGFINPQIDNYHLLPTSKAIGLGHYYGLADDLDGHPRLNLRNDAGAYQYWFTGFTPLIRK